MDDSAAADPRRPLSRMGERVLWHSFGALTTVVFMVGAISATKGNSWLAEVPVWLWVLISAIGFVGMRRYGRWYRS